MMLDESTIVHEQEHAEIKSSKFVCPEKASVDVVAWRGLLVNILREICIQTC